MILKCKCGSSLRVPDQSAGKKVRCSKCQSIILVPNAKQQAADTANQQASRPASQVTKPLGRSQSNESADIISCPCGTRIRRPKSKSALSFKCPKCGKTFALKKATAKPQPGALRTMPDPLAQEGAPPRLAPVYRVPVAKPKKSLPIVWIAVAALSCLGLLGVAVGLWLASPIFLESMKDIAVANNSDTNATEQESSEAVQPTPFSAGSTASFGSTETLQMNSTAEAQQALELLNRSVSCLDAISKNLAQANAPTFRESSERILRSLEPQLEELDSEWESTSTQAMAQGIVPSRLARLKNAASGFSVLIANPQSSNTQNEVGRKANSLANHWIAKVESALGTTTSPANLASAGTGRESPSGSSSNTFPMGTADLQSRPAFRVQDWEALPDSPSVRVASEPTTDYAIALPDSSLGGQTFRGAEAFRRQSTKLVFSRPMSSYAVVAVEGLRGGVAACYDLRTGAKSGEYSGVSAVQMEDGAISPDGARLAFQSVFQFGLLQRGEAKPLFLEKSPEVHTMFFRGQDAFCGFSSDQQFTIPVTGEREKAVLQVGVRIGGLAISASEMSYSPDGEYVTVKGSSRDGIQVLDTSNWRTVGRIVAEGAWSIQGCCFTGDGQSLLLHLRGSEQLLAKINVVDGVVSLSKSFASAKWNAWNVSRVNSLGPYMEVFPGDGHFIVAGRAIFKTDSLEFVTTIEEGIPGVGNRPISATQVLAIEGKSLLPRKCL